MLLFLTQIEWSFHSAAMRKKYASKIMNVVALHVKLLIQMSYMGKRFFVVMLSHTGQ